MKKYLSYIKQNYKVKKHIVYYIFIAFTLISSIISFTSGLKLSTTILFETIGYGLIVALSLSLVVGFLGELSLGHAGFMSIGAIMGVVVRQTLLKNLTEANPFLSLLLAMVIGGTIAAICGFIIGLPALRLKGDYLAIVTLAFGEIVKTIFQYAKVGDTYIFGGAIGLSNEYKYESKYLFIITFVIVILVIALINNLLKSKHGRAIMSIRDNEIASKAMGVNVTYYKLFVFVLSAFIAGVGGVLFGVSKNTVNAATFNYNYSINNILVMVVLGGMGNINGTIVASIVVSFLNVKLQTVFTGNLAALKNIIFALILILVVIYNNAPKLKWIREKYNLANLIAFIKKKIFKENKLKEEANQKDYKADWSIVPTKIEMDAVVTTDLSIEDHGAIAKPDKGEK